MAHKPSGNGVHTGSDVPPDNGVAIARHRVNLDGADLVYEEAGTGEPLILVHGLVGSTRWWAKNVPSLAAHFRVLAVDLIGFGGSHGDQPFDLSAAAGYLARWMDELGIARVNIVGHSMGGFIAADLAAAHPDRVQRLVLVDPASIAAAMPLRAYAFGLARAGRYTSPRFLPLLVADTYRAGPSSFWHALRQLTTLDLQPKLERLQMPALLVWGEHDTIVPLDVGRRLADVLPRARFALIPGAGHNAMWDRPAAFNRLVIEFLEGGVGRPAGAPTEHTELG